MIKRFNIVVVLCAMVAHLLIMHNYTPAQSLRSNSRSESRFYIKFGGGWGNYDMKRISGFYQADDAWPHDFDNLPNSNRISGGPGLYGEAGIYFSRNWSISAGMLYLTGEASIPPMNFLDDYNNREQRPPKLFYASLLSPYVKLRYDHIIQPLILTFSAGVGYTSGQLRYPFVVGEAVPPQLPPEEHRKFSSGGVGYLISLGAFHRVLGPLYFGSEVGYRLMKTGYLQDKAGNTWEGMNLDFSGPYVGGSLYLRL